jgi:hypothetical protein
MIDIRKLRPLKGHHLIRPEEARSKGGIVLPPSMQSRYPPVGEIVVVGPTAEDIRPGDYAILDMEGVSEGRTYYAALLLILKDHEDLLVPLEVEPVIRETMETYRANPATEDRTIVVETLEKGQYSMLASDILDFSIVDLSNAMVELQYLEVRILLADGEHGPRQYYLTPEDSILFIYRSNDAADD